MGQVFDRMIAVGRARSAGGGLRLWLSELLCRSIRKKAGRRARRGRGKLKEPQLQEGWGKARRKHHKAGR